MHNSSARFPLSTVLARNWPGRAALGLGLASAAFGLTAVGSAGSAASTHPAAAPLLAHWVPYRHLAGVVDVAGPRTDGSFSVAASERLFLLDRSGDIRPFARGRSGYSTATGPEPYITVAGGGGNAGSGCAFPTDTTFAIEPSRSPGVIAVDRNGRAQRFADLPSEARPNGITFDSVGRFGHRILVSSAREGGTTVFAIDCRGRSSTITAHAPIIEGGMVVAPPSFGSFGGDLIAPDEGSGRIFAIGPTGRTTLVVRSLLPRGPDIGVESAGIVPQSFGRQGMAYLADRFSRGNAHPGTNNLLRIPGSELIKAGVRPGDLLVAGEGGAQTIAVRCSFSCTVRHIADGPVVAHAEGHIAFATG